jgi:phage FluMu protein gp41
MADTTTRHPNHGKTETEAEKLASAAEGMAEVARRAMDQGQDFIRLAIEAVTQTQTPIAERSLAETMRLTDGFSRIANLYFQFAEDTIARFSSLALSYGQTSQALGQWPSLAAKMTDDAMKRLADAPQELAHCQTPSDFVRWQTQTLRSTVENLIAAHLATWRFAGELAENATKPLKAGLPAPVSVHR